jgi:hypothetical protein
LLNCYFLACRQHLRYMHMFRFTIDLCDRSRRESAKTSHQEEKYVPMPNLLYLSRCKLASDRRRIPPAAEQYGVGM